MKNKTPTKFFAFCLIAGLTVSVTGVPQKTGTEMLTLLLKF